MAYPVTLNGRTYTLADFEGNNYVDGLPDAFEDFVTHAGDLYNDTSTTSNSIGTGSKTFTVSSGKPYQAGTPLRIADAAAPATNFLDAVVTSYSGTSLVVEAIGYGGSGTLASWTVNIGGAKTIDGTLGVSQGGTGATTAAAALTNLGTYSKTEADSRFLNVSGEASDVTMTGNVTIGDAAGDTLTVNATPDFNTGINVDGTITSDGLTVAGNVSVDGGTIKLDGNYPVGTDNVALGNTALDSTTGSYNTAVGSRTLTSNTSGQINTAVGTDAMYSNTTGSSNMAFGGGSLYSNTTGSSNTAHGSAALYSNTTASNNTAVGYQALYDNTTGEENVAVGRQALANNTTANNNSALGYQALHFNTTGTNNTAIGREALEANTTGSYNTAVGFQAAYTTDGNGMGINAFGAQVLYANTTGNDNVAMGGYSAFTGVLPAMRYNTTGSANVAIGVGSMSLNTTGGSNVALGRQALYSNTQGNFNTASGVSAMLSNTTGSYNTALGFEALYQNTTAAYNTAVGYGTLYSNTTGTTNTAVGINSLRYNTTASDNTGVGHDALVFNTTGANNTSVGKNALKSNTTASNNTAFGFEAGYNNTTATENVFVGGLAGRSTTTGFLNCFVGHKAGQDNTTSGRNAYFGHFAGESATGYQNTYIGQDAGTLMTTGSKNTIVGRYNGNQGGLDIRTSSNNIVLSDGDGNVRLSVHGSGAIAFGTNTGSTDIAGGAIGLALNGNDGLQMLDSRSNSNINTYRLRFYNTNGLVGGIRTSGSTTYYDTSSDYRLKENAVPVDDGIEIVKQLQPKRFNYIADPDTTMEGFIAHELQEVVPLAANGEKDAVDENGILPQTVDLGKLVPILTAALKEAITKIETLEAKVTALENA